MRPAVSEYAPYYANYVALVPESDIVAVLQSQAAESIAWWRAIPESEASKVHAPYTWSVHQVLRHIADGERIFGYRLLRIARGDKTPLAGFDDAHYAAISETHPAPLYEVIDEFASLRQANALLFKNLPHDFRRNIGEANGSAVSAGALAYILAGHVRHHDNILLRRKKGS